MIARPGVASGFSAVRRYCPETAKVPAAVKNAAKTLPGRTEPDG